MASFSRYKLPVVTLAVSKDLPVHACAAGLCDHKAYLMSNPTDSLTHWLMSHPRYEHEIRVRVTLKAAIRDKLDQSDITERMLFPGLDGLSQRLTRYYR